MRIHITELANSLANGTWTQERKEANSATNDDIQTALLLDIMLSLRVIANTLKCPNTRQIPMHLKALEHLAREFWVKPKRKRKARAKK